MDLANILAVTTLLVLLSISGIWSATVTLTKSSEKGQLGNNSISLFCDYGLSSAESVLTIELKRKRTADSSFVAVAAYYEDALYASYFIPGLDLFGRVSLINPTSAHRRAILQFNSIKCADKADYRCEVFYAVSNIGNSTINSDISIVVTAPPTFENQSLIYTPSTNLAENQNVTFTCIGNVGREPQGTFSWYKYVWGQSSGMVITNGINPVSLVIVAGSCTFVRTETLTLKLTKDDNLMVIRCTVQQTTMTEAGDGNIQTDHISVYYSPRISPIVSDPYDSTYSEVLKCNTDSKRPSNYVSTMPDGTVQTGSQLCLTNLTINQTGRYTCTAYTVWGGQNYTANISIIITVVETTTPPPTTTTTTTTRSSSTVSVTKKPGITAVNGDNIAQADAPIISRIVNDLNNHSYNIGLALLNLACNADSNPPSNYVWTFPDGTVQTAYQLRLINLTTNQTVSKSLPLLISTTTISSAVRLPVTKDPGPSTTIDITAQQTTKREIDSINSSLFAILFGVLLGVSVFLVTILSIYLHKHRIMAADLKQQLQNRSNTYDELKMRVASSEPYTALNIEPSDAYHQSAYFNPYEGLHRTLESSEQYDILEGRL